MESDPSLPPSAAAPDDLTPEQCEELHMELCLLSFEKLLPSDVTMKERDRIAFRAGWQFRAQEYPVAASREGGSSPDEAERQQAAERLREFIRAFKNGGCRVLTLGAGCECPLCDVGRLASRGVAK